MIQQIENLTLTSRKAPTLECEIDKVRFIRELQHDWEDKNCAKQRSLTFF